MPAFAGMTNNSQVARGINILLGIWLFISAFIWPHTAAERANTWIMGILCVLFALIATGVSTARWLNTALAVWLFISVWALPHDNAGTAWNNVIVAIVVFFVSLIPGSGERAMVERRAPA